MLENYSIILGSQSPRRSYLLKEMGFLFDIKTIDFDESYPSETPVLEIAEYIAIKKNQSFEVTNNQLVITADSIVILNDQILGKPKDKKDAIATLRQLSNQKHYVSTGVCIQTVDKLVSFNEVAEVTFKPLTDKEIKFYIDKYKPFDKAGSYGIQDWIGLNKVENIKGTYTNIMGLPTARLYAELSQF